MQYHESPKNGIFDNLGHKTACWTAEWAPTGKTGLDKYGMTLQTDFSSSHLPGVCVSTKVLVAWVGFEVTSRYIPSLPGSVWLWDGVGEGAVAWVEEWEFTGLIMGEGRGEEGLEGEGVCFSGGGA